MHGREVGTSAVEDFCFIVDLLDYKCGIPLTSGGGSGAWVLRKIAHFMLLCMVGGSKCCGCRYT